MKFINQVDLIGDVVHVFKQKKFAIITVRTVYGSFVPNYPQVRYYGEIAEEISEELVGKRVKASGYYMTSKKKGRYSNDIVGLTLEETTEKSVNKVVLNGYITKIDECKENTIRIIIKTLHGKYKSTTVTYLYTKEPNEILEKYKKGDRVELVGNIQTKKRVYPDVTKYYQDITLRDIKKIEE